MEEDGSLGPVCERLGLAMLLALGSAVVDHDLPAGDLDVAVAFLKGSESPVATVWTPLQELVGPVDLDVLDLDRRSLVARGQALLGWPLYEHEPGARAEAQMTTVPMMWDAAWLRRAWLEAVADG